MDIVIRPGILSDSKWLCEISSRAHLSNFYLNVIPPEQLAAFKKKYTSSDERLEWFNRQYTSRLADSDWHYFVAEGKEGIYGFTCCKLNSNSLQLKGLFVDPRHQSKGVGKRLFAASCSMASGRAPTQLKVLASNEKAKRLYEQFGFRSEGMSEAIFFGVPLEKMEQQAY